MFTENPFTSSFSEWNKTAADLCQRAAQQQIALIEDQLARMSDRFKRFAYLRKPEDLIQLNKECLNEELRAAMQNMQNIMAMSMENMERWNRLCNSMVPNMRQTPKTQHTKTKSAKRKQHRG